MAEGLTGTREAGPGPPVPPEPPRAQRTPLAVDSIGDLAGGVADDFLRLGPSGFFEIGENVVMDSAGRLRPEPGSELARLGAEGGVLTVDGSPLGSAAPVELLVPFQDGFLVALVRGKLRYRRGDGPFVDLPGVSRWGPPADEPFRGAFTRAVLGEELFLARGEADDPIRIRRDGDLLFAERLGVPVPVAVFRPPPATGGPGVAYTRDRSKKWLYRFVHVRTVTSSGRTNEERSAPSAAIEAFRYASGEAVATENLAAAASLADYVFAVTAPPDTAGLRLECYRTRADSSAYYRVDVQTTATSEAASAAGLLPFSPAGRPADAPRASPGFPQDYTALYMRSANAADFRIPLVHGGVKRELTPAATELSRRRIALDTSRRVAAFLVDGDGSVALVVFLQEAGTPSLSLQTGRRRHEVSPGSARLPLLEATLGGEPHGVVRHSFALQRDEINPLDWKVDTHPDVDLEAADQKSATTGKKFRYDDFIYAHTRGNHAGALRASPLAWQLSTTRFSFAMIAISGTPGGWATAANPTNPAAMVGAAGPLPGLAGRPALEIRDDRAEGIVPAVLSFAPSITKPTPGPRFTLGRGSSPNRFIAGGRLFYKENATTATAASPDTRLGSDRTVPRLLWSYRGSSTAQFALHGVRVLQNASFRYRERGNLGIYQTYTGFITYYSVRWVAVVSTSAPYVDLYMAKRPGDAANSSATHSRTLLRLFRQSDGSYQATTGSISTRGTARRRTTSAGLTITRTEIPVQPGLGTGVFNDIAWSLENTIKGAAASGQGGYFLGPPRVAVGAAMPSVGAIDLVAPGAPADLMAGPLVYPPTGDIPRVARSSVGVDMLANRNLGRLTLQIDGGTASSADAVQAPATPVNRATGRDEAALGEAWIAGARAWQYRFTVPATGNDRLGMFSAGEPRVVSLTSDLSNVSIKWVKDSKVIPRIDDLRPASTTFGISEVVRSAPGAGAKSVPYPSDPEGFTVTDRRLVNPDSDLEDETAQLYTQVPGNIPNDPPPKCNHVASAGGRLFLGGVQLSPTSFAASRVAWSNLQPGGAAPWGFGPGQFFDLDAPVTAMERHVNNLVVFTEDSVHRAEGVGQRLVPYEVEGVHGCPAPMGVVDTPGGLVYPSLDGLFLLRGTRITKLTDHVPRLWARIPDVSQIRALYDPRGQRVHLFYSAWPWPDTLQDGPPLERALVLDLRASRLAAGGGFFTTHDSSRGDREGSRLLGSRAWAFHDGGLVRGDHGGTLSLLTAERADREAPQRADDGSWTTARIPLEVEFRSGGMPFGDPGSVKGCSRLAVSCGASQGALEFLAAGDLGPQVAAGNIDYRAARSSSIRRIGEIASIGTLPVQAAQGVVLTTKRHAQQWQAGFRTGRERLLRVDFVWTRASLSSTFSEEEADRYPLGRDESLHGAVFRPLQGARIEGSGLEAGQPAALARLRAELASLPPFAVNRRSPPPDLDARTFAPLLNPGLLQALRGRILFLLSEDDPTLFPLAALLQDPPSTLRIAGSALLERAACPRFDLQDLSLHGERTGMPQGPAGGVGAVARTA